MAPARAPDVSRPDEPVAPSEESGPEAAADVSSSARTRRALTSPSLLVTVGLLVALAIPFVVALVALHQPREHPLLDMAMTEIRVRAVGTTDAPLIGLPGRIGELGRQGSHPGPLSFWSLAPAYRLFGASAWSLHVASAVVQLAAMGGALWIAYRRGGIRLVVGVAVILALLARAYGMTTLTEAWNPHLPLMMWVVLLLAVWSVLCDDLAMLPVAVFAGSFCAQTHIPYLGVAGGLIAFMFVAGFVAAWRRHDRDPGALLRYRNWTLVGLGVGALVWLLPVIDQLTATRGNFSVILEHFRHPPEDPVGLGSGIELVLIHLNPWTVLTSQVVTETLSTTTPGSWLPGLAFLVVWGASAVAAWRLRVRALMRLNIVLAVALVLAVVSAARIFGFVWYYLLLWAWGITALMVLATAWTVVELVRRRLDQDSRARAARFGTAAAGVALLVVVTVLSVEAADTERPVPGLSDSLGEVLDPTVATLADESAGYGRDGRYLVTWEDPVSIGAQGWGLLNELDRRGFDVGLLEPYWTASTRHQRLDPGDATARVHLAVGAAIGRWANEPGVERIVHIEPRSVEERAEFQRLREQVIEDLEVVAPDLVPEVDLNLLNAAADARVSTATQDRIARMIHLGLPVAVFVGPPVG